MQERAKSPPQLDFDEDDLERRVMTRGSKTRSTLPRSKRSKLARLYILSYKFKRDFVEGESMVAGVPLRREYDERRKKGSDGSRDVRRTSFTELHNIQCTDDAHVSHDDRDSRHDVCPSLLVALPTRPEDDRGDGDQVIAPAVNRLRAAETWQNQRAIDLDVLQRQAQEVQGDLDILFRAVRRQYRSHPEEPSAVRRRIASEIETSEPDREEDRSDSEVPDGSARTLSFLNRASRSRDDEPAEEDHDSLPDRSFDYDLEDLPYDDEKHDVEEFRRRQERESQYHMNLTAENNLEVVLRVAEQGMPPGRYLPFALAAVDVLYQNHARSFPFPGHPDPDVHGEEQQTERYQGRVTFSPH